MSLRIKNIIRRVFIGVFSLIGVLLLSYLFYYFYAIKITFLDHPYFLSNNKETLEVCYVTWGCDCADFIETKYYNDSNYVAKDDDYLFIEAADSSLIVPRDFYVNGRFTKNFDLPDNFIRKRGFQELMK